MKSSRIKAAVFGFIIGALTMSSVSVFAIAYASGKVEAWVQDKQINLIVDGNYVDLPDDMHILNYNNRIYTPTRLVADALGATVDWEDARQAVIITPPEPEVIEVIIEPEEDDDDDRDDKDNKDDKDSGKVRYYYSPLPVRKVNRNIEINITRMEFYNDMTWLYLDFKSDSQFPIMFLPDRIYLEYDGEKFPVTDKYDRLFVNSLSAGHEEEDMRFEFENLPKDADEVKVTIAFELFRQNYSDEDYPVITYEFYIDPTDEEHYY